MARITVEVKGLKKIQEEVKKIAKRSKAAAERGVKIVAIKTQKAAVENIGKNGTIDTGLLRRVQLEILANGLEAEVFSQQEYAPFVEFGTGPHKTNKGSREFIEGMLGWGKRKGLSAEETWAVIQAIRKRGTPARPFMRPAAEENVPKLPGIIRQELKKELPRG